MHHNYDDVSEVESGNESNAEGGEAEYSDRDDEQSDQDSGGEEVKQPRKVIQHHFGKAMGNVGGGLKSLVGLGD